MARDLTKRAKVRKYLRTKKGREESDRGVALALEVSRALVTAVRRDMIVAGEHPDRGHVAYRGEVYKPGTTVRGGYVWNGKEVVKEIDWLLSQASGRRMLNAAMAGKPGQPKPPNQPKPKAKTRKT